jgi:hypothetical protein
VVSPRDRTPYLGGADGAPPIPPPGGYRAARRVQAVAPPGPPAPAEPRPRAGALGWAALAAAALLAFVLLVMWAAGATDAIYGVVVLALQLAVLVTVIAAVVSARNRRLGAVAVAIVLLINVGTMGAASALTHQPGTQQAGPEDDYWAAYPGIRGQGADEILSRTSLEGAQRTADEVMAAIRERLTAEYGFAWVEGRPSDIRAERNGYGGESMLVQFTSERWSTTEPVTDHQLKLDAMATIDEVLAEYGFYQLTPLNDPSSGFDPAYLERFYGGTDPRTQVEWEWYSDDWPGPMRFYANVTDLTHDDDGGFRTAREGQVAGTDEPLEGLRISFLVPEVLSEADVDEFERRMEDYPAGG